MIQWITNGLQTLELLQDGATAIFVGVDGRVAGIFAIADPVKATTPQALAALKAEGRLHLETY